MVLSTKPMLDYVNKGIEKVKTSPWTGPLALTLKVTGGICSLAGDAGVPVIGLVGAGLCLGGDLLSDLQGEEGRGRGKGQVEGALQESFAVITDSFLVVQQEVSEVKDVAYKTLEVASALRYREGIEKVDAAYDVLIAGGHDLKQTVRRFDGYIIELETTQRQSLNPEKVGEYLILLKKSSTSGEKCSAFFCYVLAVRAKYLQLLVVYYSFHHDYKRVQQEFEAFNTDVRALASKYQDNVGTKRMTPAVQQFTAKLLGSSLGQATTQPHGSGGGWVLPPSPSSQPNATSPSPKEDPAFRKSSTKCSQPNMTSPREVPITVSRQVPITTTTSLGGSRLQSKLSNRLDELGLAGGGRAELESKHNPRLGGGSRLQSKLSGRLDELGLGAGHRREIDSLLDRAGVLQVPTRGDRSRSPSCSKKVSVSTSTKEVNGRKVETRVEVRDGVETREVWEEGVLVARTVAGREQPL